MLTALGIGQDDARAHAYVGYGVLKTAVFHWRRLFKERAFLLPGSVLKRHDPGQKSAEPAQTDAETVPF
jgi:hypothetical protein